MRRCPPFAYILIAKTGGTLGLMAGLDVAGLRRAKKKKKQGELA